ncbi:hypothetical protein [uncultured Abyssibacter sp.]|uniref:hypothetical protein n=1 Tax=uncultured Abyssibacter sp. TaxID=2320202 RepID=UPI0032B220EB
MKHWLIAILAVGIMGCSMLGGSDDEAAFHFPDEETESARELMIGNWFGEKRLDDGSLQEWLVKRAADGTYLIEFRLTEAGGSIDTWSEVGIWGIRKPIYFTAVRGFVEGERMFPINTNDHALYDAYEVIVLDDDEFTYRSYTSGNRFTVKRVSEDFRLGSRQGA